MGFDLETLFSSPLAAPYTLPEGRSGVILYGKGALGRLAASWAKAVDLPVFCEIDEKSARVGLPVTLVGSGGPIVLVSTVSDPFTKIFSEIRTLGITNTVLPFYDYAQAFIREHPLANGWVSGPLSRRDQEGIRRVYAGLDSLSQQHYLTFLAYRCLRQDWMIPGVHVVPKERYFIPSMREAMTESERYLDVGAHTGEAFAGFLAVTRERYASAMLIEPDPLSAAALMRFSSARVYVRSICLGDTDGLVPFMGGYGFASGVRAGGVPVACMRLDRLHFKPSFLKIHAEGSELAILRGGIKSMKLNRPKLAVTCYHSRDGLWAIQDMLMSHLKEYTWHFRMHSWCGTGAVLYGMPEKFKARRFGV